MGPTNAPATGSAYADLKYGWKRYGAIAVAAIICLVFLAYVRSILPPFIIAFVVALFLSPLVRWLERRGIARRWSVVLIYIVGFAILAGVGALLIPTLVDQSLKLSQSLGDVFAEAKLQAKWLGENWRQPFLRIGIPASTLDSAQESIAKLPGLLSTKISTIGQYFAGLAAALGKTVLWIVIILIVTAYLLIDMGRISAKILSLMAPARRESAKKISAELGGVMGGYVRGVVIVSALYGISATIIFLASGTKYALVIGLIAGVLYIVPYIGAIITLLLAFVICYVSHGGAVWVPITVVIVLTVVNTIFDNLLMPKIVGGKVGLHPIVAIFAMLCGVTLFGIWGMILAVPLAGMIQVIVVHIFPQLAEKPLIRAPALEPEPSPRPAPPPGRTSDRGGREEREATVASPSPQETPAPPQAQRAGRRQPRQGLMIRYAGGGPKIPHGGNALRCRQAETTLHHQKGKGKP